MSFSNGIEEGLQLLGGSREGHSLQIGKYFGNKSIEEASFYCKKLF